MKVASRCTVGLALGLVVFLSGCAQFKNDQQTTAANSPDAVLQPVQKLYKKECAGCHGEGRLGAMGPALLPENLSRLKPKQALAVIAHGRTATQMPEFGSKLNTDQIASLGKYIYTKPLNKPVWGNTEINSTHIVNYPFGELSDQPSFKADMMNLFLVVELGDHHVTLLDGDTFTPIFRFKSRFALHGGPKYSPDGRYVFFASRDGWISKFDIYNLKIVAEVRAGINTRNLAVSSDGRYVMVANYLPNTLVLLDAKNLDLIKTYDVKDAKGKGSRLSAVYNAPPRHSFVAALKDIKEVWEIPYPSFQVRQIKVEDYLDDFFFDPSYRYLIGATRPAVKKGKARGKAHGQVVDMDTGKEVAKIPLAGMPHLGSGITWNYKGHMVMATPNLGAGEVSIIDMTNWKVIKTLKTDGPGFFMRSHSKTPYAWVDVFFGPHKDEVHIIDKRTLEIVKTLKPVPGKTAAHVEFTKDGKYALLSIWDMDGAVIVYDAKTFKEIKRLPMVKPSGKYNVYNKTHYERGTSH